MTGDAARATGLRSGWQAKAPAPLPLFSDYRHVESAGRTVRRLLPIVERLTYLSKLPRRLLRPPKRMK